MLGILKEASLRFWKKKLRSLRKYLKFIRHTKAFPS